MRMRSDAVTAVFETVSQTESEPRFVLRQILRITDYGMPLTAYVVAYARGTNFESSDR